ncbi:MAG TPA: two-component regulator propeller domain-containing protein, partial [Chitinophagaceae bacterium]
MRLFSLIFLTWFLNGMTVKAQRYDEKDFILYSTRNGLSDNRITSLNQNESGYLWIGTNKGLNRFDGLNFLQFYSDSNRNSLPNDYVRQLKKLGIDKLGASSPTGLHIIDPRTLEQRNIIVPPGPLQEQNRESSILGMAGDERGNIFLLTGSGFYHFNDKGELAFRYDHYKKNESKAYIPFGRSDGIIKPEHGVFLLATTAGPYIYYVGKKALHPVGEKDDPLYRQIAPPGGLVHFMHCNNNSFSVIQEGAKGMAWFDLAQRKKYKIETTLTGLENLFDWRSRLTLLDDTTFIINASKKGFYLLRHNKMAGSYTILPKPFLTNFRCVAILLDKHNRLWIGTDRGLLQEKKNKGNVERIAISTDTDAISSNLNVRMI